MSYATGLKERNWHRHPMGDVPGISLWRPSANGPIVENWADATIDLSRPKQYEDDPTTGMLDLVQGNDPSCTWFSTGNCVQWFCAYNSIPIPALDCRAAWIETTGGRGGEELATAAQWTMTHGIPLKGGGRIKATAWADLPNAAALLSAVILGRPVLMGWMHPAGAHAQCGLAIGKPKTLKVRGTWGQNASGEVWRDVPYASLVDGISRFGGLALLGVEILKPEEDAAP